MLEDLAGADEAAARRAALAFSGIIEGTLRAAGAYRFRHSFEDLIQEVLVSLLENAGAVEHPAAWLRRVTYNAYIADRRRDATRTRSQDALECEASIAAVACRELAPECEIAMKEELEELRQAIAQLPKRLREVVETVYPADPTHEPRTLADAARSLGVELHTVKNRLRGAISALSRTIRRERVLLRFRRATLEPAPRTADEAGRSQRGRSGAQTDGEADCCAKDERPGGRRVRGRPKATKAK